MAADPRIGADVAGYRIVDVIGRGRMGTVYLAEHAGLRRRAALRILAPELAADRDFRERFAAESRLAASLDHPNIVPVYEAGEVEGTLFIAMRHVDGDDLGRRLDAAGALDPGRVVRLLGPIADALDAAHAAGLVHGDVKAANILLDRHDDRPYLTGFGLTTETGAGDAGLTRAGQILGTPDHIAPEQIATGRIDGRADQYALACVVFEAMTGPVPHERATDLATLSAHRNVDPPDVRSGRTDLPAGLSAVFARGLARMPDERFDDCRSLIAAASAALESSPVALASHSSALALAREVPPPARPPVGGCSRCGAANQSSARFCSACGMALDATATDATREVRKLVTILFADVSGSTSLGERLDPETLRALMGRYFSIMKRIIEAHGGTVEKFIGDAVMAVFGIPVLHEDDAVRAVRAAADIQSELGAFDAELGASQGMAFRFRTGLNTGEVVAGDPADGQTLVTGDAVNTAARIEQAAAPGEILLGRLTYQLVRDAVTVESVEPISAKGKAEPLQAYRLLTVDAGRAGHARRLHTPLVGRERELAALRNAFERVSSERSCQLFTLLGAAGVGKSRLAAEFAAAVETEATVLRGRCLSYGEGITYWPIGEVIRAAAGIDEAYTAEIAKARLRSLLAGERDADAVAARVASAIGLSRDPAPQEEVFWAIRKLFEHLARERPLVVVIEDIHWAEPTLLDLVDHIADWSRDAPIFVLCPTRPELLDTRAGWGGGKLNATNVLLEPLGADAATRLIAALPGGTALAGEIESRITAATEGNPLFIEEFLAMLVDDGLLVEGLDGAWHAATDLAEVRIPTSISALLTARLERLSPDERAVAERASVVGRVFDQAAVAELASDALRPAVGPSLLALVRKEVVRPDRSELTAGNAFKFRHILIRDAAYEALPKAERAVLHERFAAWLERTVGERMAEYEEIVGYHLEQAYDYRTELGETADHDARTRALALRAGRRLAAAGRRAAERDEIPTAVGLLSRAEALLVEDPKTRFETLLQLVDIGWSEDYVATWRAAQGAEVVAADLGDLAVRRARLCVAMARSHVDPAFQLTTVRVEAESAIRAFESAGDIDAILDGLVVLILIDLNAGHWHKTVTSAQLGLDLAAAAGLERRREDFAIQLVNAHLWGSVDASESLATIEGLLRSTDRRLTRAHHLSTIAILRAILGDRPGAEAAQREATSIWDDLGHRRSESRHAYMRYALDDLPGALDLIRTEVADLERRGDTGLRSTMVGLEAWILALVGEDEDAARAAGESRRLGAADDAVTQILWRAAESVVLARRGEAEEADRVSADGIGFADGRDPFDAGIAWLARAHVLSILGRHAEATEVARRARDLYAVKGFANGVRRAEALMDA